MDEKEKQKVAESIQRYIDKIKAGKFTPESVRRIVKEYEELTEMVDSLREAKSLIKRGKQACGYVTEYEFWLNDNDKPEKDSVHMETYESSPCGCCPGERGGDGVDLDALYNPELLVAYRDKIKKANEAKAEGRRKAKIIQEKEAKKKKEIEDKEEYERLKEKFNG